MKPIPFNALAKIFKTYHRSQNLVHGVAIDSRRVVPGDLFFALPGEKSDGHQFLEEVVAKGAVGAVVRKDFSGSAFGIPLIHADDVLADLHRLARTILSKRKSKVVAITGSVGKTTTKEFVATLLGTRYKVAKSPLSYNSQATLPLSILKAKGDEDILVLEMGMSEPGQINKLVQIAPPDVAVLTHICLQHATQFPTGIEGIAKEKGTIFSHPKTKVGIYSSPFPVPEVINTSQLQQLITYSLEEKEATYFLEKQTDGVCIFSEGSLEVKLPVSWPILGHYHNFLAACSVARYFDLSWSEIEGALHLLKLPPMRFESVKKGGIHFINDAYNASPESVIAALRAMPSHTEGRRVAILGEMDDLGRYTEEGHQIVADEALQRVDVLYCVGQRAKTMYGIWEKNSSIAYYFESRQELEDKIKDDLRPGDTVLIKGARSLALDQILNLYNT